MRERETAEETARERERERKRERKREWERERESVRERERERETEYKNQAEKNYPDNFPVCWLRSYLSRFFTGISRRKYGELISLIGNQRVGIFPPKSDFLFVLSLALIWYQNFQDRTFPLGGDTWPCFWRKEEIIRIIRIKKYLRSGLIFRSNIS